MFNQEQCFLALGEKIRELRVAKGLTQQALSKLADIDRGFLSSIEQGKRPVSFSLLLVLIAVLEINLSLFFSVLH